MRKPHERSLATGFALLVAALLWKGALCQDSNDTEAMVDFDILGSLCELERDVRNDIERANVEVEFWYAVGTAGPLSNITLHELEQLLFTSIKEETLWCTPIASSARRSLNSNRQLQDENQRLGVVTVTPGIADVPTEFECPNKDQRKLQEGSNTPNTTQCTVVHGEMSVLSQPIDRTSYVVIALQDMLEAAMLNSDIYIDNVEFLSYLGNDQNEALNLIAAGGNEIATGGRGEGQANVATIQGNESPAGRDDNDALVITLGFGFPLLILIVASIFSARNDRKKAFNQLLQQPVEEKHIKIEYSDDDPPGNFHEGMHHYLRDGTRYYSSRCEQCREFNCVFLSENATAPPPKMGTIPEHETATSVRSEQHNGSKVLRRADLRLGLSQHHMGINVHTCKSATCTRCGPNSPLPTFVSTGVVSRTISQHGSSTATSSPISSINSNSARSSAHSSIHSSMHSSVNSRTLFPDLISPTTATNTVDEEKE